MTFKPLLAEREKNMVFEKLRWPLLASAKIDGLRIICHPTLGPVTRSLKPLPNNHIRSILSNEIYSGLDGEVIVLRDDGGDNFNNTQSGAMSAHGMPRFIYWVFDHILEPDKSFILRYHDCLHTEHKINSMLVHDSPVMRVLEQIELHNQDELDEFEAKCLAEGHEGVMLRDPRGKYKYGRSTFREHILMKVVRYETDEAKVIGFEELFRNQNEPTIDALGHQRRSAHQAGLVPAGMLGALVVEHPTWGVFNIGSGFDVSLREEIWKNQSLYLHKQVTFKFKPHGSKDAPRHPIFKGFREPE
jgi:DNA ligase-1